MPCPPPLASFTPELAARLCREYKLAKEFGLQQFVFADQYVMLVESAPPMLQRLKELGLMSPESEDR